MVTFLLGFFGYCDNVILSKVGTKNIFFFPYLWGYRLFLNKKNNFPYHGIYLFTGSQGSGKTLSMVYFLNKLINSYPEVNYKSNLFINNKIVLPVSRFEELYYSSGNSCYCIDEIGIWCNSKRSKDVNEEILEISAQNRKSHRLILATCQQYYQVQKDIRTQATVVIECSTLFDCLTVNRYYKPDVDEEGKVKLRLPFKFDFFLHTQSLYDFYDTLEVIKGYK